jgi:hypothetical protein
VKENFMLRRFRLPACALFVTGLLFSASYAQSPRDIGGRVFEAPSDRGIENLEVKLTPPNKSNLPIRLTSTDPNGSFHFAQVKESKYLLEVSQGANLLYRSEIDTATQNDLQVPLQKR